jgi:hypothetical protein
LFLRIRHKQEKPGNAKDTKLTIHGQNATLILNRSGDRVDVLPEQDFADPIGEEHFPDLGAEDVRAHQKNWFDCIRSGNEPNAPIDLAIRAQTVLALAETSERLKVTCLFDEKTRSITDYAGKAVAPLSYGT